MHQIGYAWRAVNLYQCSECAVICMSSTFICKGCSGFMTLKGIGRMEDGYFTGFTPSNDCLECGSEVFDVIAADESVRHRCIACGFEGVWITNDIPF